MSKIDELLEPDKLFVEHLDYHRYKEAYELFKRQNTVIISASLPELEGAYEGFRRFVSEDAAKELQNSIIKEVEHWRVLYNIPPMLVYRRPTRLLKN